MRPAYQHDIRYSQRNREPGVLIGVRNICRHVQIGPQTFYKLHTEYAFPATRLPDGRWCTSRNLIDEWILNRWKAKKAVSQQRRSLDRRRWGLANPALTHLPGGARGGDRGRTLGVKSMKPHRIHKRLYNLPEAAEYLGRSEWSVRWLIWSGALPCIKHGRRVQVDLKAMEAFIDANRLREEPIVA